MMNKQTPPNSCEGDLFSNHEKSDAKSPFFIVSNAQKSLKQTFPVISLNSGFNKAQARTDAIYILRYLANQAVKNNPVNGASFISQIQREMNVKDGTYSAELMSRDALIDRYFGKFDFRGE